MSTLVRDNIKGKLTRVTVSLSTGSTLSCHGIKVVDGKSRSSCGGDQSSQVDVDRFSRCSNPSIGPKQDVSLLCNPMNNFCK